MTSCFVPGAHMQAFLWGGSLQAELVLMGVHFLTLLDKKERLHLLTLPPVVYESLHCFTSWPKHTILRLCLNYLNSGIFF